MRPTDVFKNDPQGRQIMEGVKMREMQVDNIMNSKDEFHQPGEIIPVLEGAGRRQVNNSHNRLNNNNQVDNSNRSSGESGEENPGENLRKKKVTRSGRSDSDRRGGGVTTRARARRENIVV